MYISETMEWHDVQSIIQSYTSQGDICQVLAPSEQLEGDRPSKLVISFTAAPIIVYGLGHNFI